MASEFETLAADWLAPDVLDMFGESVDYTVVSASSATTITARVIRGAPQQRSADRGRQLVPEFSIWIKRSDVPTVTLNGDTVRLSKREGSNTSTLVVSAILDQTAAMWHLAVN